MISFIITLRNERATFIESRTMAVEYLKTISMVTMELRNLVILFALSIVKIKFALSFGCNWLKAVITYE